MSNKFPIWSFLFIALICLFHSAITRAETISATDTPTTYSSFTHYTAQDFSSRTSPLEVTATAACNDICTAYPSDKSFPGGSCYQGTGGTYSTSSCYFTRTSDGAIVGPVAQIQTLNGTCNTGDSLSGTTCTHHVYSCPYSVPAYTLSGSSCTRNTTNCTVSQTTDIGTYDLPVGTDPNVQINNPSQLQGCVNGCTVFMTGATDPNLYSAIVNGVKQYYLRGDMNQIASGTYASQSCSGGTTPLSTLPNDSCASGQTQGTVNGKTVCINNTTGQTVNPNQPGTTQSSTTTRTTDGSGNTTTSTTTINNVDNSTTTTSTVTNSSGQVISSSTTTIPGAQAPTPTTASKNAQPQTPDICLNNPNIPACKDADSGTASTPSGLYTKDTSGKTVSGVINTFKTNIQAAGFYSAATGFFSASIPTGGCSGLDGSVAFMGATYSINMSSVLCSSTADTIYTLLSIGLLIGASFGAFRMAFL